MSLFPEADETTGTTGKKTSKGSEKKRKPAAAAGKKSKAAASTPYLALARKYRPGSFDEVVGQDAVTSTLRNSLESNRLHHAYLFSGIRGVGKTTVARLFARALNCENGPTSEPCGTCNACKEVSTGLNMDVIEIDAASNRGVDDVEPLREAARYAPSRDRYKVFILDEVHMLSNAAFNSLLKILEEPPPRIVWILATTEYRKLPPTVISRCQHFEFRRVPREEVAAYLGKIAAAEGSKISEKGLRMIAAAAGGSVRDAVSLLDQVIAFAGAEAGEEEVAQSIGLVDRRHVIEFLSLVASKDPARLIDLIATLADAGTEFPQFAAGLLSTARDATLIRVAGKDSKALSVTQDEAEELLKLAGSFGEEALLRIFNALLELPGQLRLAPQPRFTLEAAALRLARMADLQPIEDLIARLQNEGPGSSVSRSTSPLRENLAEKKLAPRIAGIAQRSMASPPEAPPVQAPARKLVVPAAADVPTDSSSTSTATTRTGLVASFREQFLKGVQSRKMSLRTFLEGARSLNLDGEKLEVVLGGNQSFFRQGLESAANRELIQNVATELLGRPIKMTVTIDADGPTGSSGAASPAGAPRPAGKREILMQKALSEPGVKLVMDAFGGQIVDIKKPD
jgi:DNA polymerase-3 subunit gamma/tau